MKKIICFLLVVNVISVIETNVFALTDAEYNKLIGYLGKKVPNGFEMSDVNEYYRLENNNFMVYRLHTNDKGNVVISNIAYQTLSTDDHRNKRVSAIKKLQSLGYTFIEKLEGVSIFESKKYRAGLGEEQIGTRNDRIDFISVTIIEN
ncbi:MAG: hypothetical protein LBV16_09210 [Elusimicrobiota bacterium]|jgi:hypothetical protein|nr:hypothetical protein [Elusimicrobiota bacterium]